MRILEWYGAGEGRTVPAPRGPVAVVADPRAREEARRSALADARFYELFCCFLAGVVIGAFGVLVLMPSLLGALRGVALPPSPRAVGSR